jgi:hypothetical protein
MINKGRFILPVFLFALFLHAESKVQRCLQDACAKIEAHVNAEAPGGLSKHSRWRVRMQDSGAIQVYVYATDTNAALQKALKANGMKIEVVLDRFIQGWLPYDKFAAIEALDAVTHIRAPSYGVARAGSVTTEGDALHFGPEVRDEGFDGSGVTVGVISDGVDSLADAVATGDLPGSVLVAGTAGSGDEGTAMLEIVHDVAPGATLRFSSGNTTATFISSISSLRDAGAQVIVDDIGFPDEAYFEDDIVAQAAQAAVVAGVTFVSACGNSGEEHYADTFDGLGGQTVGGLNLSDVHDFGGGDFRFRISIPAGSVLDIVFQWDNPFFTANDNYDIYLVSTDNTQILARGDDVQNGNDFPLETIDFGPQNNLIVADLVIDRASGSTGRRLKFFIRNATFVDGFGTAVGAIFGHPAAEDVFAVAAVNSANPTSTGLEDFSSHGPVTIVFPSLTTRNKPEATGIDNVVVSGAGNFPSPFSGTSAAAPHVAAIAALLLDANSSLAPNQITALLQDNSTDLGTSGFDSSFGAGLVNAQASLTALQAGDFPAAVTSTTTTNTGGGGGGGGGGCGISPQGGGRADVALMTLMISLLVYTGWRQARVETRRGGDKGTRRTNVQRSTFNAQRSS